MRGFAAILRREIEGRRAVFLAAAVASLVPLAVPIVRGLSGAAAADARGWTAFLLAIAFGVGIAAGLGALSLAPAIASRRIGFDLARPISAWGIWAGAATAACLTALVSAGIVYLPARMSGTDAPGGDLFSGATPPRLWPLLLLASLAVLFALGHAASIIFRSRSALLALDVALLLGATIALSAALARLPAFLAAEPRAFVLRGFTLLSGLGLLGAGYGSIAHGRADIRRAHRALSAILWITAGAGALGANAYASWVMAATPAQLRGSLWATPAPTGGWILLEGRARGADATFLYESSSGHSQRAIVVDWRSPVFSANGKRAAWVEGRAHGGPYEVLTLDLDAANPKPRRTRVFMQAYPALLVLSDDGSLLSSVERGVLSIADLAAARTLASARVAEDSRDVKGFFVREGTFRIYRDTGLGGVRTRLDVLELDFASKRLSTTGGTELAGILFLLESDASGDRLIAQMRSGEIWLLDGRTGAVIHKLADESRQVYRWPGFLADGRIVLAERDAQGTRLRVYSAGGARQNAIALPTPRLAILGAEAAPGQIVLGMGDWRDGWSEVVDLESGVVRKLGDRLLPAARLASFSQFHAAPGVGSDATKLFNGPDHSLIRLDPATGERRVLLGKQAGP